jgi:XPB/Ssl2-like helicase family protein
MTHTQQLLNEYHFDILKAMVAMLGITPASNKKVAHVKALSAVLFTPKIVKRGLALISERERKALTVLQRLGGQTDTNRFRGHLLRQEVIEPPENTGNRSPYTSYVRIPGVAEQRKSFVPVIGQLMITGLVCGKGISQQSYTNRTKIYYDNMQSLYIPEEVQRLLPDPPPLLALEHRIEQPIRAKESSAREFQRDLYFYWSTAHTTPLSLTKEARLYRRDLRLINDALLQPEDIQTKDEPDLPRLFFLRMLLTDIGILKRSQQTVQGIDQPPFLALKPAERIRRTFIHWRDGLFWNELLSIEKITILGAGSRLDPVPPQITQARESVLDHMAELHRVGRAAYTAIPAEERWIPFDQLIDSLRIADYDFLFPRNYRPSSSNYYSFYGYTSYRSPYISYGNEMGWSISPRFEDEAEGWEVVEARFIRAMLLEPLHWMGLVDIGYVGERPFAYRLTPVGEWVLGVGQEVMIPEGEGKVIIQPNFEMFALDPISDLTLSKLDEFADRMSAERAIKYQLSRNSVYRAQRNGWTSERIIDTLNRMSDTPLPQNVLRTIQEWQAIHERIRIYRRGSLLQAADAKLLDRLFQDPLIRAHLGTRPDPTAALIVQRPEKTEALIQKLQKSGYPPARTRSADEKMRPSFRIDDTGQLHFDLDLPSIYLYQQIAPFTGRDERGDYYLTQSAIQEAIAGGMSVETILERLRALHLGPLPRWVEIKVRAWAKYYGKAAIQTITLIQFKDEKTLRELLAEPELEGMLQQFVPAQGKALAVTSQEALESLYEIFAERNIPIERQLD